MCSDQPPPAGALAELAAALRLLAAISSRDPPTALELLHVEVPLAEGAGGDVAGGGGPDMLTLACHALTVLCQLAEPPTEAIGGQMHGAKHLFLARPADLTAPVGCFTSGN